MLQMKQFLKQDYTRNFFKLFSGMLLAQGLSFALSPLLSRLYTPEDFGLVAFYMAIAGLLSMAATLKYEQAIMLPAKTEHASALLVLVVLLGSAFAVFISLIIYLFHPFWVKLTGLPEMSFWIWFLPISILLHTLFQSFNYMANRLKHFGTMATANVSQHIALNVVRITLGSLKVPLNGLLVGQLIAPVFSIIFFPRKVFPLVKSAFPVLNLQVLRELSARYIQYPKYNLLQSLSNNLASSLPIFMFTSGFSGETAGLYAFGYTFVFRPLSLFSQSTLQVLSQKIIEDYNQHQPIYPNIRKLVFQFFKIGILPFIVLGLFAPTIFSFIFSPVWEESGRMIQILLPWLFLVYLTSPLAFLPELLFRQKKSMIIDFFSISLRFLALYTGIWFNDIYLALFLFSGVSFFIVGYALFWYLQIAKRSDLQITLRYDSDSNNKKKS